MIMGTIRVKLAVFVIAILFHAAYHTESVYAHGGHTSEQIPFEVRPIPQTNPTWKEKYGMQIDLPFSGPLAFSHLSYKRCLEEEDARYDIGIIGLPFDTGVTYRNGYMFRHYL